EALESSRTETGKLAVAAGYVQEAGVVERYKRLATPVRRALNPRDRASVAEALEELAATPTPRTERAEIQQASSAFNRELEGAMRLGGPKVPRRQILSAWLDAAAFYNPLDREHAYDRLIDEYGKAAEGLASELTEQAAQVILRLDEAAAAVLGEPVVL